MITPGGKILKSWFELLSGLISVPVYRTDAPSTETGNYVLLRLESSNDKRNNQSNVTNPVLITEVVTKYESIINDQEVFDIDSEIGTLLSTTPSTHNLPTQAGIQIVTVVRQNQTVLPEDDGTFRYNRLITRNIHNVLQT
jgi:hypothetical protein